MNVLKRVDKNLLRRILGASKSTPIPALYLETGTVPVQYIIKGKCLLYLHYLLNQPENSLLSKMFYDQVQKPIKNDWFWVVKENLSELGLDCYSLNDIKIMKKYKFKNLVRSSCQDVAFRELKNKTKEKNLIKIKNIKYDNFEMKRYLLTNEITHSGPQGGGD